MECASDGDKLEESVVEGVCRNSMDTQYTALRTDVSTNSLSPRNTPPKDCGVQWRCYGVVDLPETDSLDPRVHVLPMDTMSSSTSLTDSPPDYLEHEPPGPLPTSLYAAIEENKLLTSEWSVYIAHQDYTNASESCSLMLDSKTNLSDKNSAILAICRICHQPGDEDEILISPCRCAGTLQFIHNTCLQKWLQIVAKRSRKAPKCELCHFQYHRHKKFKLGRLQVPRVSFQDKVLHIIFLVALVLMIGCAITTVVCFLSDKGQIRKLPRNEQVELSTEEIITLTCGIIFFVSFFVAMSVEIKAKHTVYQLFVKFIMRNMEWKIDPYDRSKDALYAHKLNINNSSSNSSNNNNNNNNHNQRSHRHQSDSVSFVLGGEQLL